VQDYINHPFLQSIFVTCDKLIIVVLEMCQLVILHIHPTPISVNFKVRHAVML